MPDDSTRPEDPLADLRSTVEDLTHRVERLERERSGSRHARLEHPASEPTPKPSSAPRPTAATKSRALLFDPASPRSRRTKASDEAQRAASDELIGATLDPVERSPRRTAPRLFDRIPSERLPVVLMGAAGGLALLMGLLYFAWYSIQQGWISPAVRVALTHVFGAAALGAAWVLGGRGQRSVAAGLGGAGLGAWFGATLVARHNHELIGAGMAFALLATGATAGLVVAAVRELRLLAFLAAFGAFVTPLSVGSSSESPHELMAFELLVAAFLYALEDRRRWPELGHLAVVALLLILGGWGASYSAPPLPTSVLGWGVALLVIGHVQALLSLRRGRIAGGHAAARIWWSAFFAWPVAMMGARGADTPAFLTLGMAVWNVGVAWSLRRSAPASGSTPALSRARAVALGGCASVAWLQVFAFAAQYFDDPQGALVWWTVMSAAAFAWHLRRISLVTALPIVVPYLGALGTSFTQEEPRFAWSGFVLGALPIVAALWHGREASERLGARRAPYLGLMLTTGGVLFALLAWDHLDAATPRHGWFVLVCVAALALIAARVASAPTATRAYATLALAGLAVLVCLSIATERRYFDPVRVDARLADGRLFELTALLGVAGVMFGLGWMLDRSRTAWSTRIVDLSGLVRAGAVVLAAMLAVAGFVADVTDDPSNANSLMHAGWSVVWATGALSLLVRGLFGRRAMWRRAGIAALFLTAAKLVLVDLMYVSMLWRVLSFMGLGVCMLAGAYAYRRLASTLEPETRESSDAPDDEARPAGDSV